MSTIASGRIPHAGQSHIDLDTHVEVPFGDLSRPARENSMDAGLTKRDTWA
jgi:hypothetical protein